MSASSLRGAPLPVKVSGWLGAICRSATTAPVAAASANSGSGAGAEPSLDPPLMSSKPVEVLGCHGTLMMSQCRHTGRSISAVASQVWEVTCSTWLVTPRPTTLSTSRYSYDGSGAAIPAVPRMFGGYFSASFFGFGLGSGFLGNSSSRTAV